MTNPVTSTLNYAANEIRSADAVVVMGAGVSFAAGMPLAGQLAPLVWHALDANPTTLTSLCSELGQPLAAAKSVVADDPAKVAKAFRHIRESPATYRTFQRSICSLDESRAASPSLPHTALARLVHARKVIEVISFNWDTLLEAAFKHRYGFEINAQGPVLSKPHGDCRAPGDEWILPHEAGFVPQSLLERLSALAAARPRVLLIIGYSERDAEVVKQLIQPLANRWRVIRISPSATGEGAVPMAAGAALEELACQLSPEPDIPGWKVVTFANQRGIEAAISGERLGPRDVDACPRLPHFSAAFEKLSLLHTVEISGDSGSGKSITIWQLAHAMHRRGWQVLRLDTSRSERGPLDAIRTQSWRTIAVVDDSQTLPRDVLTALRDLANNRLMVIVGTTDTTGELQGSVRAAAKNAVEALAAHYRQQRQILLPLVRRFDSHIGDGFLEQRIETRIDQAAEEQTPWLFAYVLRGGTRKVRDQLGVARDFERADLLLILIGLRQMLSLDGGVSVDKLIALSHLIDRDATWVHNALANLVRQRSVLISDSVRCLHLMAAGNLVEVALDVSKGDDYNHVVTLVRDALQDKSAPLQGVSWILYRLWSPHGERVVTDEIATTLVSRCFTAKTHLEVRDACFVLSRLLGRRKKNLLDRVFVHQSLLREWIVAADITDASAIGGVLNNIRGDDSERASELITGIAPETLARKTDISSLENGYIWGDFIGHLYVEKEASWEVAFKQHIPRDTIRTTVKNVVVGQLPDLLKFVQGIARFDFEFALELLELAAPFIAHQIGQDSLSTYAELFDISIWVLGEGLFYDAKPTRRQRQITKRIFQGIQPTEVVSGILSCRYGDWENYARVLSWMRRAHPTKHRAVVDAMDWPRFDAVTSDKLAIPGRELTLLLANLVLDSKTNEPVASWLKSHSERMQEIGSRIVALCPEVALAVVSHGGKINLSHDHASWALDGYAIGRTAALDENTARIIVRSNISHFAKGVAELSFPDGMADLLAAFADEPEILHAIIESVDLSVAKSRWPNVLADKRPDWGKPARKVLAFIAQRAKGELQELAVRLPSQVRHRRNRG